MLVDPLPERLAGVVVLALAVSALSMTITKAKIFRPMRNWIEEHNSWFGELVSCPYCMSHWLAFPAVAVYQPRLVKSDFYVLDLFITALLLVALAAVWSGLIFRAFADVD